MSITSSGRSSPFGRGITPFVPTSIPLPKGQYATSEIEIKHPTAPFELSRVTLDPTAVTTALPLLAKQPAPTPTPTQDVLPHFNSLGRTMLGIAADVAQDYPMMNKAAAKFIRDAIKRTYKLDVDPDRTYFHDFANGHTSRVSFNGWAHNESPVASRTLTQAVLANPLLHEQSPGTLDGYLHGIYSGGPSAASFNVQNEIKLLPSQLMSLIYKGDFYQSYKTQLTRFWNNHRSDYRALAKAQLVAHATKGLELGSLFPSSFSMVMKAIDLTKLTIPLPLAELNRQTTQQHGVTVRTFDINGYPASDILHFKAGGHPGVVIYMPGEAPALRQFPSDDALKDWVCANNLQDEQRQNLRNHFSLYNRQDGATFLGRTGVDHALQHLAAGDWDKQYINQDHNRIASTVTSDVFTELTRRIEHRDFQDADTSITSSSEVNTEIWRERMEILTLATSLTAPFAAPIDLILAMGSLMQLTLGINNAVSGDTAAIRGAGITTAVTGGLGITEAGLLIKQQEGAAVLKKFITPNTSPVRQAMAGLDRAADLSATVAPEVLDPSAWLGTPVRVNLTKARRGYNGVLTVDVGKASEASYITSRGKTYAVSIEGAAVKLATPPYKLVELDELTSQWVVLEPLSSHVPSSSKVYPLIQFMKSMGYRATEEETNNLIAMRVFSDVRRSYQKGLKSSNKIYLDVPKAESHAQREEAAYDAISENRRRPPVPVEAPPTTDTMTDTDKLVINAANCGELSNLSAKLVMENGGHAELWYVEGGDHAFTVVGVPPPGPTVDFSGWEDVWIVDAWANIACHAEEYHAKLLAKMQLWQEKGKHISDGSRIFEATDPRWLGPLTNNLKRVSKQPTVGNPQPWAHYPAILKP